MFNKKSCVKSVLRKPGAVLGMFFFAKGNLHRPWLLSRYDSHVKICTYIFFGYVQVQEWCFNLLFLLPQKTNRFHLHLPRKNYKLTNVEPTRWKLFAAPEPLAPLVLPPAARPPPRREAGWGFGDGANLRCDDAKGYLGYHPKQWFQAAF